MTRYGKGTAINLTRITSPDQINVINDNFRKIQTQLMGVKNYLEPIAQAGKEASDRLNQYLGSDPPVSHPQMVNYAQKQIAMSPTPPDDPDVGDVWFVTDDSGNVIAIRHWDGTQWVDDVNNQAIQDAITQAQQETEEAKQQAQDAVDRANQAVQSANDAIQQAQQGFDAAQEALTNATNAQSKADDAMAQAQTAFDNAQNALTTAQNALDASNVLSQRVDQNSGDISTLYQTTDSLGSRIIDAEGDISAIQQMADSLSTRIENAEGNISSLTQTALGLQTSVSDLQGDVSILTQTANSLNSTITNVQNALNNLQIGGRNLLLNSGLANGLTNWRNWGTATGATREIVDVTDLGVIKKAFHFISPNGNGQWGYAQDNIKVHPNTTYTASFLFKSTNGTKIYIQKGNSTTEAWTGATAPTEWSDGKWHRLSYTWTTSSTTTSLSFYCGFDNGGTGEVWIAGMKLELGNKATDWTPAPEDYDARFSSINQTIDSITTIVQDAQGDISALQQTANSLATRITGAEGNISTLTQTVDGLQTQVTDNKNNISTLTQTATSLQSRLTTAEGNISTLTQTANSLTSQISSKADQSWVSSQISQLSDAINLRVQKNDVINQINISTEGILIDGKKIHITGQTTIDNAVIKDSMIESVSASKISATSLSAISANLGNVIAGTITGVTINGGTMIGTNLIVNDGDVIFRDSVTQSQYSLIPRNNMLDDHSFELMKTSGSVGSDGYFAVSVDSMGMSGGWYVTGSPKLSSAYNTDIIPDAIFGRQAVLVNSSNYVEQVLDIGYLKENKQYTISVYARRPNNYTAGIPKIYVYSFYDDFNQKKTITTWSTTYTASTAPPSDYSIVRYTYTFTMPSRSTTGKAEVVGIRLLGANSNWVMLDGVQLVEGSRSSIYFDESSLWGIRRLPTSFYEPIIAEGFVYTDAIENNLNGRGENIYIRPKNELRVTAPGSTTSYLPLRASNVYTNSVDINDLTSGVNLYIRPKSGGEVRVTVTGSTSTYAPIRAKEYNPPNSLREMKKNIEEFTDDVLDTFRNIKTYTFNYNFEEDGAKKTLGLMLDEAPEILWNTSGDSINMYSSIGYLFTGLKQTVAKLDEYKATIEDLEKRLSVVENKMA